MLVHFARISCVDKYCKNGSRARWDGVSCRASQSRLWTDNAYTFICRHISLYIEKYIHSNVHTQYKVARYFTGSEAHSGCIKWTLASSYRARGLVGRRKRERGNFAYLYIAPHTPSFSSSSNRGRGRKDVGQRPGQPRTLPRLSFPLFARPRSSFRHFITPIFLPLILSLTRNTERTMTNKTRNDNFILNEILDQGSETSFARAGSSNFIKDSLIQLSYNVLIPTQ